MSTKIDKRLIAIFLPVLLVIVGGILIFLYRRRIQKKLQNNNRSSESIIIPLNQGRETFGKCPLVIDFYVNFQYMKQDSNARLISDYQTIENQSKQLETKGQLEFIEGNKSKNRYKNIKPYVHNMVKLLGTNDYINASRICFKHYDANIETKCNCTDFYIATQAPIGVHTDSKVSTIGDFWKMIVENNVCIIVNLTKCGDEKNKNCQYWPDKVNDTASYNSGYEFLYVTLLSLKDCLIFTERIFKVSMNEVEITVQQFHLESWKENNCPDIENFLQFYSVYKKAKTDLSPIVVHCGAGVGRTGTFIMIDEELSRITRKSDRIEIFNNLLKLRTCRCKMVQNEKQYIFIYTFIYEYLSKLDLIEILERSNDATTNTPDAHYEYIMD